MIGLVLVVLQFAIVYRMYREAQAKIHQRNPIAHQMGSSLLPALQVWAYVQSIPETERAIIGMGKRDAAFDAGACQPHHSPLLHPVSARAGAGRHAVPPPSARRRSAAPLGRRAPARAALAAAAPPAVSR